MFCLSFSGSDPEGRIITQISPEFPTIPGYLQTAVNVGSELIYYETGTPEVEKPIYKYFVANNTWIETGEMLYGRDDFP